MRLFFLLLILIPLAKPNYSYAHEYHVAIVDLEHNVDSSNIEVTFKLNTADLNKILSKEAGKELGLNTKLEVTGIDSILYAYTIKHFSIKTDSIEKEATFIGYEHEEEFTYVYVEFKKVDTFQKIFVSCTILFDVGMEDHGHSHQSNLINVKNGQETKSVYLNNHRPSAWIEF